MWKYHNQKMIELKKLYQRTANKTKNKIQELIDTFNFNNESIFNIADSKSKRRINTYIEQWKDDGLLNGYFGTLAKSIYSRTRVKNSEILELLIYSAYIEEQSKQKEKELQIIKEDVSYYYNEGINEVRQARKHKPIFCIIPDSIFLGLLSGINSLGYTWQQYNELTTMNNANQIYRQALINIQQQKELKMDSDEFKIIYNRQEKQKLNINGAKYSGVADVELIGLNNQAKIKGIEQEDKNAKYMFIAIEDNKTTPMCHSLNGQIFNINAKNEFNRYYGENTNDLSIRRIKCFGAVIGLNMPPISHHWHWCRSTITYQVPVKNDEKDIENPQYIKSYEIRRNYDMSREIDKAIKEVPNKVYKMLIGTRFEKCMNDSYYDRKNDIIYISEDSNMYDIIHEIGHLVETKQKIMYNRKYIDIQKDGLGNVLKNEINPIQGYPKQNGQDVLFIPDRDKFLSEYQRRVYRKDINGKPYYGINGFNTETLGDYFSEGFRYYIIDKKLVKKKDYKLYEFIKGMIE